MNKKKTIDRALILSGGGARGAFQVGVLKYLDEIGWHPDMICGSSAGAVNAAALGSGISVERMCQLWLSYTRKMMYRITWPAVIRSILSGRKYLPACDTSPLKVLLEQNINIAALRNSKTDILITALNMNSGQIKFFTHRVIRIEHLMAASAIPMLFPWQYIDGEPYWDAGIMVNTPVAPAFGWEAKEIIAVLHSPIGAFPVPTPLTLNQTAQLAFEHFLIGSYTAMLPNKCWQDNPEAEVYETPLPGSPQLQLSLNGAKFCAVAPRRLLGFRSFLNFSPRQARRLIDEGYSCARMQLGPFFQHPDVGRASGEGV